MISPRACPLCVALLEKRRGRIVVLVMREVLLLVALGAGIGLAAAIATTRLITGLPFGSPSPNNR